MCHVSRAESPLPALTSRHHDTWDKCTFCSFPRAPCAASWASSTYCCLKIAGVAKALEIGEHCPVKIVTKYDQRGAGYCALPQLRGTIIFSLWAWRCTARQGGGEGGERR